MEMTVPLKLFHGGNKDPYLAFALITLALAVISFYTGISGIVKAELFPADVRALGVGLSYALANAPFGGTAEFVALWFKDVGMESTFFWYVTVMLAIAFIASLLMPNPKVHGYLDGAGTVEEALGKKKG
jgi:MHS family alpha-ketoglutarate permease-like MFS transporter